MSPWIAHASVPPLVQKMKSYLSPDYFKRMCFQGPFSFRQAHHNTTASILLRSLALGESSYNVIRMLKQPYKKSL